MKWQWEDKQIGELFEQLRREDQKKAPSFQEVLYRDEPSGQLDLHQALRYGLVTCSFLLLSATLLLNLGGGGSLDPLSTPGVAQPTPPLSLAEWTSPTDFLMVSSGEALVESVPVLETDGWWELAEVLEQ